MRLKTLDKISGIRLAYCSASRAQAISFSLGNRTQINAKTCPVHWNTRLRVRRVQDQSRRYDLYPIRRFLRDICVYDEPSKAIWKGEPCWLCNFDVGRASPRREQSVEVGAVLSSAHFLRVQEHVAGVIIPRIQERSCPPPKRGLPSCISPRRGITASVCVRASVSFTTRHEHPAQCLLPSVFGVLET